MRRAIPVVAVTALLLTAGAPARAGGGGCTEAGMADRTTTVLMARNCFGPTVSHVSPGDTVRFHNADNWNHTVTGAGLAWGSTYDIGPDGFVDHRFDEVGVYAYVCILHPGMVGAVVVGDPAEPEAALAAFTPPAEPAPASEAGPAWGFALGLAGLGTVVGMAAGGVLPRRRPTRGGDGVVPT